MARRILIHAAALVVGISIGVVVAGLVQSELRLDPVFLALIVATFIFLSQVIANIIAERVPAPREPVFKEPVIRGTEPWGWLKPANGIGAGFPLNKECIRLGRGVEMDIMLNNASISRRHAQIRRLPDGCLLEDLGSRNGVFVNGTRVKEQNIADGDNVGVGEMKFVFVRVTRGSFAGADVGGREEPLRAFRTTGEMRSGARPNRRTEESEATTIVDGRNVRPFDETTEYGHDDDPDLRD